MTQAVAKRSSSESVDNALIELLEHEQEKGFGKGEFKEVVQQLAEKHEISWHTLKNRYYIFTRDNKEERFQNKNKKVTKKKAVAVKKAKTKKEKKEVAVKEVLDEVVSKQNETEIEIPNETIIEPAEETTIEEQNESKNDEIAKSVDEKIYEFSQYSTSNLVDKTYEQPKDVYHVGQLVDIEIKNLQPYGAFGEILDGKKFNALLHVSEITDAFIKDVSNYVQVGDVIRKAKITFIEGKRINLSTKHLHVDKLVEKNTLKLPENPPINPLAEKLLGIKDKLTYAEPKEEEQTPALVEEEKNVPQPHFVGLPIEKERIIHKYEEDIKEMSDYLRNELGVLSPLAKSILAEILEKRGIFKTTRAMDKVLQDFMKDIGVLFMRELARKLDDCL